MEENEKHEKIFEFYNFFVRALLTPCPLVHKVARTYARMYTPQVVFVIEMVYIMTR